MAIIISSCISLSGVALSIATAFWVSGKRQGVTETEILYIKRDVADIKTLFKLTFVEPDKRKGRL
jgi:hypothetical protein